MNYSDKLKDPRWQKKRLLIMDRDNFTCQICNSDTETLNVHHLYYENGNMPWEYPEKALITLCEQCHSDEHDLEVFCQELLVRCLKKAGFTNKSICTIAEGFGCISELPAHENLVAHAIYSMLSRNEEFKSTYNHFKNERI